MLPDGTAESVYAITRLGAGFNLAAEAMAGVQRAELEGVATYAPPADAIEALPACFLRGGPVPTAAASGDGAGSQERAGAGDFDVCADRVVGPFAAHLLPLASSAPAAPSGLPFLLFDNFAKVGRVAFGVDALGLGQGVTVDGIEARGRELCAESLEAVEQAHGEVSDAGGVCGGCRARVSHSFAPPPPPHPQREGDVSRLCLLLAFGSRLLRDVYGLQGSQPLYIIDTADGFEGNWALGAATKAWVDGGA